jgi:hypothetical protein
VLFSIGSLCCYENKDTDKYGGVLSLSKGWDGFTRSHPSAWERSVDAPRPVSPGAGRLIPGIGQQFSRPSAIFWPIPGIEPRLRPRRPNPRQQDGRGFVVLVLGDELTGEGFLQDGLAQVLGLLQGGGDGLFQLVYD